MLNAKGRWCSSAGKVTAGLTESNGSLPPGGWLIVTCGLTAFTPGSAPGPTLVNEYGKPSFLPWVGFEPTTCWLQVQCSTRCATAVDQFRFAWCVYCVWERVKRIAWMWSSCWERERVMPIAWCCVVQLSAETWRPGAAGVQSLRQQARYDQSHVEEHPAAEETDEDEDEDESSQQQWAWHELLTSVCLSVCLALGL